MWYTCPPSENNVQEELFDQILRGKLEFPSPDWDAVSLPAKVPPPPPHFGCGSSHTSNSLPSPDADQPDAAGERGQPFHRGGGPVTPLGDGKRSVNAGQPGHI